MANTPDRKEKIKLGLRRSPMWKWLGLTLALLAVMVLTWVYFIDPNTIALTVGNKKYTKRELNKIINEAKVSGFSRDKAIKELIDYEKRRQVAKKLGIEPTKEQLEQSAKSIRTNTKTKTVINNTWSLVLAYPTALEAAITQAETGYYTGTVFLFYFSHLIEPLSSGQAMATGAPVGYRDPEAIAKDRAYAKDRAEFYHNELKARRTSNEKVLVAIKTDKRLSPNGAANQSTKFTTSPDGITHLGDGVTKTIGGGWVEGLPQVASVGVTDIAVGKVSQYDLPGNPKVDGNFYFINVESIKDPEGNIREKFKQEMAKI